MKRFFHRHDCEGIFKSDDKLHEELLLFIFMPILQKELNEFMMTWNSRDVRQSAAAPGGVPDVIFHMPGPVDFQNQGTSVERRYVNVAEDVEVISLLFFQNKDLYELFACYVHIHSLILPEDPESRIQFYAEVLKFLQNDGFIV